MRLVFSRSGMRRFLLRHLRGRVCMRVRVLSDREYHQRIMGCERDESRKVLERTILVLRRLLLLTTVGYANIVSPMGLSLLLFSLPEGEGLHDFASKSHGDSRRSFGRRFSKEVLQIGRIRRVEKFIHF